MKSMITLDREFEDEIMPVQTWRRQEYDAVWEVYNSQPLSGGSTAKTIKLIERALAITTDELLTGWLNDYKAVIEANPFGIC